MAATRSWVMAAVTSIEGVAMVTVQGRVEPASVEPGLRGVR